MKVLVLGGTGVISRGIVRQLLDRGDEVTVFNRGTRQVDFGGPVRQMTGDKSDREGFVKAMSDRRFDAVIDMISFNAQDAAVTVEAFRGRAGHLVVCSSVAAYKRPYHTVPTREDAEELWDDPSFGYAFHKAEMERFLRKTMGNGELPITIVRPSLTFGVGAANIGVLRQNYGIVDRIRRGKPLVMFGDGTTPWSFTFVPDLAKGFVGVLGKEKAFGQAYHVTNEERSLWRDLYLEIGKLVGKEPNLVYVPSKILAQAAPAVCAHLWYEKTYPGLFDNDKIRTVIPGYRAEISLHDGMAEIVAWWEKEANRVEPEKDAFEDRMVELTAEYSGRMSGLA